LKVHKLAFVVEISLAKARKEDSKIKIKNKEELLHTLTGKETFDTGTRYFNFWHLNHSLDLYIYSKKGVVGIYSYILDSYYSYFICRQEAAWITYTAVIFSILVRVNV